MFGYVGQDMALWSIRSPRRAPGAARARRSARVAHARRQRDRPRRSARAAQRSGMAAEAAVHNAESPMSGGTNPLDAPEKVLTGIKAELNVNQSVDKIQPLMDQLVS